MDKELRIMMKDLSKEDIKGAMIYCQNYDSCNIHCPLHKKGVHCVSVISAYALERIEVEE